jgi:hypothetical protein
MRTLILAAAAMALPLLAAGPASAQTYPWCSIYSGSWGGAQNCGFSTYRQCMANVSGVGGFCQRNPLYSERYAPRKSKHKSSSD